LTLLILILWATETHAAPTESTVVDIAVAFQQKAKAWEPVLRRYALTIFRYLLIIDVVWLGIRMALKQSEIQEVFVIAVRLRV
jgi:type IV secretion system protein TrbL